jgi:hypothetical protein
LFDNYFFISSHPRAERTQQSFTLFHLELAPVFCRDFRKDRET